jgi:peptidoglycan hydrolase-like protein with peptidoglycan-binding domain
MVIRSLSVAALALLLSAPTATAAPSPTATRSGCDRTTLDLQKSLNAAGYPAGRPDGCVGPATRAAVQAFQRAQDLVPDGVAGPLTRAALRGPRAVLPVSTSPRTHVEVDIDRQILVLVRGGVAAAVYAASTGRPGHATPTGRFRVAYQQTRSWSAEYSTWLPWASYFIASRGIAVHAGKTPSRPDSHGCVRVPPSFAADVYRAMPAGTVVIVH